MIHYFKNISVVVIPFVLTILLCNTFLDKPKNDPIIGWSNPADEIRMPLVLDTDPITAAINTGIPIEQRGEEFRKYLSASLLISTNGSRGSGTITYYDPTTGYAYVTSCGHLWNGSRSSNIINGVVTPVAKAEVTTWYHNDVKLSQTRTYPADVLFWSNKRGYDSSLLRFKPDWVPDYFALAPLDYPVKNGATYHSLGCDGAREVAHYEIEIIGMRDADLMTKNNSPRPGRSGGGLLTEDGYYIGTCWGTSETRGTGVGYFTPLSAIHQVYTSNGFEWLFKVGPNRFARKIPIVNINTTGPTSPKEIPFPTRNYFPR